MKLPSIIARLGTLLVTVFAVGGCATQANDSRGEICSQIDLFAKSLEPGESKTVRLARGGAWLVDHYKACARDSEDTASIAFCKWLMENTSTEFMEANINLTLSCLQGQEIHGYIGNTGVESWTGRMKLYYSPRIEVEDVEVEVEYSVGYFDSTENEDFLAITVTKDAP